MAEIVVNRAEPVEPPVESITLTLSPEGARIIGELLYAHVASSVAEAVGDGDRFIGEKLLDAVGVKTLDSLFYEHRLATSSASIQFRTP